MIYSRDRKETREFHKIICSDCGREAEVPFIPSTETDSEGKLLKPVYCMEIPGKRLF